MEEIAAEAGIAKGAAYIYFPSKEALFVALYDAWGCTLREEITRARRSTGGRAGLGAADASDDRGSHRAACAG
jgi:AcrR family transcriptional regulator